MCIIRIGGHKWIGTAVASLMLGAVPAWGQNPQFQQELTTSHLFSDNFSSGFGNWIVGTNTIDNTIFGQTPTLVTGASGGVPTYAQFKLDTYDPAPNQNGVSFSGTQLQTKQTFSLPSSGGVATGQGIQFQIVSRVESTGLLGVSGQTGYVSIPTQQGLNATSFTYSYKGGSSNYHDEIDFENLTSQQAPPMAANPRGQTAHSNTYFGTSNGDATLDTSYATSTTSGANNSYYSQTPYEPRDTGSTATPINIYQWNTYDIDWYPNQIDWYMNGQLVREEATGETSGTNPTLYVPTEPMAYYLNFWAPGSEFGDAYSSLLTTSATAAGNEEFYYDVGDVSVNLLASLGTPVPEPVSAASIALFGGAALLRRRVR